MNCLSVNNVSKRIKKHDVLKNINLKMVSGKKYGLVGKNGSGKTMLIRSLSGMMHPTEGEIYWNDQKLYKDIDFIPNIGVIIENIGLCQQLSGFDNLKILSKIRNKISDEDIKNIIKKVGLDPENKMPVRKYSLGMKQKIVLAQALMEKPDILLLDEPTNALDEESCKNIRNIINQEAERGVIVLIASHNKEDVETVCDEIYYMDEGVLSQSKPQTL